VKRVAHWFDVRLGVSKVILPIIRHPVPPDVDWWYVFGSATLVAFIVQVFTGIALVFTYVPSPDNANASIRFITHEATFGHILRGVHYWGASAMVVLISIHVIRVIMMGSYKFPRELNWLVGVGLLFLTLGMAFTGQLLRWDQDAYWTAVVAAEQAGRIPFVGDWIAHLMIAGKVVGGQTLTRFYATHIFVIPTLIILFIGVHLYLVVHLGISEPPKAGMRVDPDTYREEYEELLRRKGVPFWPDAAWRDVVFAIAVVAVLAVLAIVVGPKEIGTPANPTNVSIYPRPDWYFLWYFALLALSPPAIETVIIVGFPLVVIILLILVPFLGDKGERSPNRRPWVLGIVGLAVATMIILTFAGNKAAWSPVIKPTTVPASITRSLPADAQAGATLFKEQGCLSCHTVGGVGGVRGPNLTEVGSRLSKDQLTWRILNGGMNMPAYGSTLSPQQLQQLIAFLSAQQGTTAQTGK
jgi:ubiquinol-cytochrome c reductase cytochrome b subunit